MFSMGTTATCPFLMSEQNSRTNKLFSPYMHEVTFKHDDKLKFFFAWIHISIDINININCRKILKIYLAFLRGLKYNEFKSGNCVPIPCAL